MPANMSDDDVLNLASLYARRAKVQPSMANISNIANAIRSGQIPPEILAEYVAMDAGMNAGGQPLAKPSTPKASAAPQSAPVPSSRPEPSYPSGPSSRGGGAVPFGPNAQPSSQSSDDPSSSPIPLLPLVAGYKATNAEEPTTQSGAKPDAVGAKSSNLPAVRGNTQPAQTNAGASGSKSSNAVTTMGMEGEVLGPERTDPLMITDQRGTAVGSPMPPRPESRVVPTDFASQPPQLTQSIAMPPMSDPMSDPISALPGPNNPNAQLPSPQNMPQYGAPPVMTDVARAPDGSGAVRVDVQGKGTFYLTQDGRILDNAGQPIKGVVPPDVEAAVAGNPKTANMYSMFKQALRMAR